MHGDLVLAESSIESDFVLTLPGCPMPGEPEKVTDFTARDSTPSGRKAIKLLYVEDDPVNVVIMEGLIALDGAYALSVAITGSSGIELASASQPDVILLDMNLPDMDGFAVLRALRGSGVTASLPVIAVSADTMPQQVTAARKAGFNAYVTKPIHFDALLEALAVQACGIRG